MNLLISMITKESMYDKFARYDIRRSNVLYKYVLLRSKQCEKCPYYRSEKVVIDGHEFYKCKEQEAHAIAYTYILNNENAKNRKVINLGGI